MEKFSVVVSYSFECEYEITAENAELAEEMATRLSKEWLPYSSERGYTEFWTSKEVEVLD